MWKTFLLSLCITTVIFFFKYLNFSEQFYELIPNFSTTLQKISRANYRRLAHLSGLLIHILLRGSRVWSLTVILGITYITVEIKKNSCFWKIYISHSESIAYAIHVPYRCPPPLFDECNIRADIHLMLFDVKLHVWPIIALIRTKSQYLPVLDTFGVSMFIQLTRVVFIRGEIVLVRPL